MKRVTSRSRANTPTVTLEIAVDVFVESYSFVRNLSQPCEVVHHGSLRIIKDIPAGSDKALREEITAPLDVEPDEVVARINAYRPSQNHSLNVIQRSGEPLEATSAAYMRHGYHHTGTEPLLVIALPAAFILEHPHEVHRVRTKEQASLVTKNARQKLIAPEHLSAASPPVRLYYVEDAGKVIAWGRSAGRHSGIAYVAGMSTNAAYRRRSIATAILSQMLADDAAQGASHSVLLSSRMGYALYRKCGYEQIGSLHMFVQK